MGEELAEAWSMVRIYLHTVPHTDPVQRQAEVEEGKKERCVKLETECRILPLL